MTENTPTIQKLEVAARESIVSVLYKASFGTHTPLSEVLKALRDDKKASLLMDLLREKLHKELSDRIKQDILFPALDRLAPQKKGITHLFDPGHGLVKAAQRGHKDKLEKLLTHKTITSHLIVRAVAIAAYAGKSEALSILTKNITSPINKEVAMELSLVFGVFSGSVGVVQYVLDSGPSPSILNRLDLPGLERCSILLYPALFGKIDVLVLLLERGADANIGDYLPLPEADAMGHNECAAMLRSRGAKCGPVLVDVMRVVRELELKLIWAK